MLCVYIQCVCVCVCVHACVHVCVRVHAFVHPFVRACLFELVRVLKFVNKETDTLLLLNIYLFIHNLTMIIP